MTLSFTAHWHDELPGFYTALKPTPLQNSRLIWHNDRLAEELAIPPELFQRSGSAGVWGGETLLAGMQPLAQVYSGHQFGVWAGQLGDGRGILLGEQQLPNGETVDWHLKGAGLTPYSRMGDGRAVLRSTIRECLAPKRCMPWYPHHPCAVDRDQRHAGCARNRGKGRNADAHCAKPFALRSF